MAALHASPAVLVEAAVFTHWMTLLNCRYARRPGSARGTNQCPTRLSLTLVAPPKSRRALDNREVSSPVEEGATGESEGRFIAKNYEISKY